MIQVRAVKGDGSLGELRTAGQPERVKFEPDEERASRAMVAAVMVTEPYKDTQKYASRQSG